MKTVFVTFIYPKAQKFFYSFIQSLENQTNSDFNLVIFNDGCSKKELEIFRYSKLKFQIVENNFISVTQNRLNALKWLLNSDWDFIIFGDIDDTFAVNRVEIMKRKLQFYPIIINELNLYNKNDEEIQKNLVASYLKDKKIVDKSMIKECNLIGFSHLAIRRNLLSSINDVTLDADLKIVDWVIATYLLEHNSVYFENKTYTRYVLHNNNIAIKNINNFEQYMFYLNVKIKHYTQVKMLDEWFNNELDNLQRIKLLIESNSLTAKKFELYMNNHNFNYYPWWSQIKNSKELGDAICF